MVEGLLLQCTSFLFAQRDWTGILPVKRREKPVIWACFPVKTGFFPVTNKCPVPLGAERLPEGLEMESPRQVTERPRGP